MAFFLAFIKNSKNLLANELLKLRARSNLPRLLALLARDKSLILAYALINDYFFAVWMAFVKLASYK